jgi:hypothetical protein
MRQIKSYALGILMFFSSYCCAQSRVVISQIFGGAECTTTNCSPYKNDFIELFNAGFAPQDLSGWSVQYASATGSGWFVTNLTSVTLQPGQYYLIAEAFSANGTNAIPTPDVTGTISMNNLNGKVALVNNTTALSGSCPTGANIIDFVGYGTNANCNEGGTNTPAPSNTRAVLRGGSGCTDANNNGTDFTSGTPNPRNTTTALAPCATLPVSFIDFKAQYSEATHSVSIYWSTAQEQNAKEFVIERSLNGHSWSTVSIINAIGNTSVTTYYHAKDLRPQPGTNLYRIRQVDVDGRFKYTGIIGVKTSANSKSFLSIFPNPTNGQVSINASVNGNEKVTINIIDVTGKQVLSQQRVFSAIAPISINLSPLGKGTYIIQLIANGYFASEKVVIF